MEQNLSASLNLSQRLDTSLIQLIDIVTMPTAELNEKIKSEAEKNPVLEIKDNDSSFEAMAGKRERVYFPSHDEANSNAYNDDENSEWFEKTVSEKEDLKEHLLKELGMLELEQPIKETAETIISALDNSGFTGPDPEALVPEKEKEYVKEAVKVIQSLEPTGVGAKDWKEALMLQIKEIEKDKAEISRYRDIIYRGLGYIESGEEDKLARMLRIGREDLDEMIKVIKSLTPFPGLKYTSSYDPYIIPEITITVRDNSIILDMHKDDLLDVELDKSYLELRNELEKKDKDARKFLNENIKSAENLLNMIKMRKTTMEKIGLMLVDKQRTFFLQGPMYLKALTMTDVADELGVSVSTISKLAQEKYVQTDWGLYPLRFFFSSIVKTSGYDDMSKTAVIYKIKEILKNNEGGKKLSDQKIADILESEGIHCARRTVNKYRKEAEKN